MPGGPGFETFSGQPVVFQGHRLILFHQTLRLELPHQRGGLVWNRPTAVLVTYPDGREQLLPIINLTRRIILIILGVTVGYSLWKRLRGR